MRMIDEGRAEQLRKRILIGLLSCVGTWVFAAVAAQATGDSTHDLVLGSVVLTGVPFTWAAVAYLKIMRGPWAAEWEPSAGDGNAALLLSAFAIPATVPALLASTIVLYQIAEFTGEAVPNRTVAADHFRAVFRKRPDDSIRLLYVARRFVSTCNFCKIENEWDLVQFSVAGVGQARELLECAGFAPAVEPPREPFQPPDFPAAWRPFSLDSDLEVWRSHSSVAWIDSRNLAVYVAKRADYSISG